MTLEVVKKLGSNFMKNGTYLVRKIQYGQLIDLMERLPFLQ